MRLLFRNEVICFTGTSKYRRYEMEKIARDHGGQISKSITSKTTLLIMGSKPGSKLDKAFLYGIHLMVDDEFLGLVGK